MVGSDWLFLYSPIPYLIVMYIAAYRHDLGRLTRPFRDRASLEDWWSVCRYLGLTGEDVKKPVRRPWKSLLLVAASGTSVVSLSWTLIPVHLAWYYLCLLQIIASMPLTLFLVRTTGPVPFRPLRDVLPFPRLGTRVRHLKEKQMGIPQ